MNDERTHLFVFAESMDRLPDVYRVTQEDALELRLMAESTGTIWNPVAGPTVTRPVVRWAVARIEKEGRIAQEAAA